MRNVFRAGVVAAVSVVVGALAFTVIGFPSFLSNPFSGERVVRDHAAVLESLEDISDYHAATGEYQVLIDIEDKTNYVPGFLKGERTTFLAQGSVDAVVDLGGLDADSVIVGESGRVTVLLPAPTLHDPVLDHEASTVLDRDRGIVDRVGGVLSDSPTSERDLYLEAASRLRDAAGQSELLERAEDNTRTMLRQLLSSAGFNSVRVVFQPPTVAT